VAARRRRASGTATRADGDRVRVARHGATEVWTIHRPEVRNAVDFATCEAILAALTRARRDRALRAVVLTGAGATFVSGGDLRELRDQLTRRHAEKLAETGRRVCDGLRAMPVPVIAALPGPAIGGGAEIAIACDVRVADPSARLSFKHARMAVTTAWGTLPKLVDMVGHGSASRLLLAGHQVDAQEALRVGLVDTVTEPGRSLETALAWADDVAKGAPGAVASLKALLSGVVDVRGPQRADERTRFKNAWASDDHREAVEAFFAGRVPAWRAR
jgi:enoyl-CoA hydratase/carnithine racemase